MLLPTRVGAGTTQDPLRAKYAPQPQAPGSGIIAFAVEPTDDGKHPIVELAAIQRIDPSIKPDANGNWTNTKQFSTKLQNDCFTGKDNRN